MDAISLYMDDIVGSNDASAQTYAKEIKADFLSHRLLYARTCFWHSVCTRTGTYVSLYFQANACLDHSRIALGSVARGW